MAKLLKSLLACAVAAFVSCFLFTEWQEYIISAYKVWPQNIAVLLQPNWPFVLFFSLVTFAVMAAIGLPLQYYWLKPPRRGLIQHIALAFLITTAILITTGVLELLLLPAGGYINLAFYASVYPTAGVATLIFWLIRRPDRDVQVCRVDANLVTTGQP